MSGKRKRERERINDRDAGCYENDDVGDDEKSTMEPAGRAVTVSGRAKPKFSPLLFCSSS